MGIDRHDRVADSYTACRALTRSRGENFTVVSRLLLSPGVCDDFAALYAFCRTADDVADEGGDPEKATRELAGIHRLIEHGFVERSDDAVGVLFAPYLPALADLVERHQVPHEPWHRLIDAFERDQECLRYETWDDLLDYCTGSANPVGRLVLLITGHGDRADLDQLFAWSDATCTALQLANHWQDVVDDFCVRDRLYIPSELMEAHGLCESDVIDMIGSGTGDDRFQSMMRDMVDRTWALFDVGRWLWPSVQPEVKAPVQLFTLGGECILREIERGGYDVLSRRPTISRFGKLSLLVRAWLSVESGIDVLGNLHDE